LVAVYGFVSDYGEFGYGYGECTDHVYGHGYGREWLCEYRYGDGQCAAVVGGYYFGYPGRVCGRDAVGDYHFEFGQRRLG
jgi:hypothetical protein